MASRTASRVVGPAVALVLASLAACGCAGGRGGRPAGADAGGLAVAQGPPEGERETLLARRRVEMVRRQIEARGVRDARVLAAMREVPRHLFVNPEDIDDAYGDHPLSIGLGQTISQPYVVAAMTEALAVGPGARVLEIGTGSGYQAAVLARLCAEVYTIEIVPELARRAEQTLARLRIRNVRVRAGDGYLGWKEAAPFDGIMITAATPRVPEPLVEQLAEGGRLVAPVDEEGHQTLRVYRKRKGRLEREDLFPVRFVPMTGRVREGGR